MIGVRMLCVAIAVLYATHLLAQSPLKDTSPPATVVQSAQVRQVGPASTGMALASSAVTSGDLTPNADADTDPEVSSPPPVADSQADSQPAVIPSAIQPLVLSPTIQIRGRIEAEATLAAQSASSQATLGDLQNGYGFRRVRLGAQGSIEDSASWVSEVELAGGNVRLRDVFVGLDAIPGVQQLRVGHFREPFSLEGMTSSNFFTFLERAPTNVISPARNTGVCGFWWSEDERILFTLGAFRDGTDSNGQSTGDGDNWAYTARLTGLPVYEPDETDFRLVHLGGALSQRVPPNGVINFTPRTGSNILTVEDNPGSPFLPSLNVPADSYQLYNLQAASVHGPLSVQAEWLATTVQQSDAGLIFVHGMYVSGSYFLTGEHRSYNRTRGSFDRIDVLRPVVRAGKTEDSGIGAIELAARFAYFDLNSPNLPLNANGDPVGTQLYQLTFGVNWYLNTSTRVMFDYTAGMPDKVGFDPTVAHIFGVRTAIFW
jgi:phosphate-selective porin OprO and OprP